ncbi:MFS transporter [Campylobacter sp. RM12637]|uniref:MFS transporter n=1 Tax=Campylobacter sp. RM12637 TaxID=2735734 RepID=UPI0030150468|nr:MFS transporter [Campylobacter sp. RM12637]
MGLSKKYNIWNKNFICVFIINFVICLVFFITTIASTDFAKTILQSSTAIAGLANGIFVIGALLSRLYFGSIIDNINIKKVMIISLVLYFIPNLYYLFLSTNFELILSRLLAGMCYGACSCACGAAVARLVPSNKRGIGIGYYAVSIVLSSAIGPFLAVYLVGKNNFNLCFIISLISILIALISSVVIKVKRFRKHKINHVKKSFSIFNYIEKSVLGVAYVVFCMGFVYGAIIAFISSYSKELNLIEAGSLFFVFYACISVFSRPISGKVFDKIGADYVIVPSILFYVASLIILAYTNNSLMMYLSAIFCALGYGNATSSLQSLAIKLSPKEKMGLANSTFFIALDVGMGISPYLLGLIEPSYGHSRIYEICAGIILFSLILYYAFVMRKSKDFKKDLKDYEDNFLEKNHSDIIIKD